MNSWIPKSKRVNFAVSVAVFSLILYAGGLLMFLSQIKKIENFYYDTESESSREKRFAAIESIMEKNQESIQAVRNFFVKKGDEVVFIEQIEEMARNSHIDFEIISIDITAEQPDPFKEDIKVRMRTEGSWQSTMSFIDKLEKMSFGVLIKDVDLNSDTPGTWSSFIELTLFREK